MRVARMLFKDFFTTVPGFKDIKIDTFLRENKFDMKRAEEIVYFKDPVTGDLIFEQEEGDRE